MSWIVSFKTWPSVSTPVTFGGGITMENGGFDDFEFATKSWSSIQCRYHFGSTEFGSYLLGSSAIAINHPKAWPVCKGRSARGAGRRRVPTIRHLRLPLRTVTFPLHERPATNRRFRLRHW